MFSGFNIGPFFIGTYAVCAVIGIFAAFPAAVRHCKKLLGCEYIPLIFVCMSAAVGVFAGMHLLYGLTNIRYWNTLLNAADLREFIGRFSAVFGGSVFYGGLIGGICAGMISIKAQKLPADITADCFAPAVALFHGFARIGCFFGGCCYGVEHEHGIVFTNSIVESANGVPRVPVQLIEAGFEFALSAVLWILLLRSMPRKPRLRGTLFLLYLLIYSVGRFIIEFWRGDDYRGSVLGLSTSQFISILVFIASALYLLISQKLKIKKSGSV